MTTDPALVPVDALAQEGTSLAATVQALVVVDAASFAQAAELSKALTIYIRRVDEVFDPICDSAHTTWQTAVARRGSLRKPAAALKELLGDRMGAYEQAVERQRLEAEGAARRERERLEAEARAQAEAEQRRRQAEAEEQRLAEATAAEEAGDREAAERLVSEPVVVPPIIPAPVFTPPVTVASPRAEGVSFRDDWRADVTDLLALVGAVAAGQQPITLLLPNQPALNQLARALKRAMNVPGVRAVPKRTAAVQA